MKIVLKPMGVVVLLAAMGGLAFLAVGNRSQSTGDPVAASTPNARKAENALPEDTGVIYDDVLKNNWTNFSWAKNDLADAKQVTSGRCIRVAPNKFEALYFHHTPMDTSRYDRITFRIHGGDTGKQQLKLMAQRETSGKGSGGAEYLLSPLAASRWTTVTVPLTKLGAANQPNVAGFWIQEATGQTLKPFYVDDVRLLKPGEAVPNNE